MKHMKALAIKLLATITVLAIILGVFYGVSIMNFLIISVLLTAISYVIGDLFLLPRLENWGAVLADYGLSFFSILFLGHYLFAYTIPLLTAAGVTSLFVAGTEYFFHQYMATRVFTERSEGAKLGIDYQTEFSSEFDFDENKRKKDHNIKL